MRYRQVIFSLLIGIFLGYAIFEIFHEGDFFGLGHQRFLSQERHEGGGVFTNPLLECSTPEDDGVYSQLNISKYDLNAFVNKMLSTNKVDFISVYVRDLNNGPWVGINEKEEFLGSSLLKVPVLISYMKLAQKDNSILDKKIKYNFKVLDDDQFYNPQKTIEVGKEYSISELLNYMTVYSDNNAANLLASGIDKSDMDDVFTSIGLGSPVYDEPYPVNVRNYAGFFRVLFNASYLNKEYSEKTLEILTHTDFNRGLTALIPKNIIVAHKFGIRTDGSTNQLHDCGIVYYPKHPYLICVMSRGGDFNDLASSIAQISGFVYGEVSKNK